eukprot:864_1
MKLVWKDPHRLYYDTSDAEQLTPTSYLVYRQWKMDENDELLIPGYIRSQYDTNNTLGTDVTNVIMSYYSKQFMKSELNSKIKCKLNEIARETKLKSVQQKQRTEKIEQCKLIMAVIIGAPCFILLLLAPDTAALTINTQNDCDLTMQSIEPRIDLNISQFLFIGSFIHLLGVILPFCVIFSCWFDTDCCYDYDVMIVLCGWCWILLVEMFMFSWSIVGFILYSDMNTSTAMNKQCGDITISWSVFRMIEVMLYPLFFLLYFGTMQREFFRP